MLHRAFLCSVCLMGYALRVSGADGDGSIAGGGTFDNTGHNTCAQATVITLPVGPPGSPETVTIFGNNSAATENDCIPFPPVHDGPVWWEAFRLDERAAVTIDLCGTTPANDPSYSLIYKGCNFGNQFCVDPRHATESGRGAPYCSDANIWNTYPILEPGTYRVPILSDPVVLQGATGPYEMHIHAEACPGACCHTNEHTCTDCVTAAECVGPGDQYHADQSCTQVECAATIGPDTVVGFVWNCVHLGRVGDIGSGTVAMSCNTTACNIGDMRGNWFALPDINHPVIGVNMYRLETVAGASRFEQVGQGWLKHGFGSSNANECGLGCTPGAPFEQIGVGCSDTYAAQQFTSCNLGPRSMIHPYTGAMPPGPEISQNFDCEPFTTDGINYPACDHTDHVHSPISHKVQIQETDLDAALHPGARYFAEGFYVAPHEYLQGNGNQNNNVSHVEQGIGGPDGSGAYHYFDIPPYLSQTPAFLSWPGASWSMIEPSPLQDGRTFLAWQVTDLGGGQWHYEYAVYNMNMDASVGSLCIPLAPGANITNVGFHAPLNQAPEPNADNYTNDPWTPTITSTAIRWDTQTFIENPSANAVRFGTLYNFRFDADIAPQSVSGAMGLFKTGGIATVATQGPSPASLPDVNVNGIPDVCEPAIPATPQADPMGRSRFISFAVPSSGAAGPETALRVRLVSLHHVDPPYSAGPSIPFTSLEGQYRWVGPPALYIESGNSDAGFFASQLQCDPYYHDWSALSSSQPSASSTLHVTGSAVVPSSVYEVENIAANCVGIEADCASRSAPMTMITTRWTDIETPFSPPSTTAQPDVGDISALVNKFRSALGAPPKTRALLVGTDQFGHINMTPDLSFGHIAACVDAFRGKEYPFTIQSCP